VFRPFSRLSAVILAVLATLTLMATGPAAAFPSSNPIAAAPTARIDAELKPHFRALLYDHHRFGYQRPGWSKWRNFYWRGSCDGFGQQPYGQSSCGGGAYTCDPADPYCQPAPYACDPRDPNCAPQNYGLCAPNDPTCNPQPYTGAPQWVTGSDPYAWRSTGVYGSGPQHITVDCREDRPERLNNALIEIADGGTIHLKGHGPACTTTLQIGKPVVIAGDDPGVFPLDGDTGVATLTAPPGAPCAVIDAGPKGGVEFRNVVIEAPRGGRSACLQVFSSAVALEHSTIHYTGESSAVYLQGGRFLADDADIVSAGFDATLWSEDADIAINDSRIVGAVTGIDARPGIGQKIALRGVGVFSAATGHGDAGANGVIGRRGRGGDCQFHLDDVDVHGFRTGMLFEPGLTAEINHSHLSDVRIGVAVDGANVTLSRVQILSQDYGVYRFSGALKISGGNIYSYTRPPVGWDGGPPPEISGLNYYGDRCDVRGDPYICKLRRDAPGWLLRHEPGGRHHYGWSGP
jgi:hypothetical protein